MDLTSDSTTKRTKRKANTPGEAPPPKRQGILAFKGFLSRPRTKNVLRREESKQPEAPAPSSPPESESSNEPEDIECKICKITFRTKYNRDQHLRGKAHTTKCRQLGLEPDKISSAHGPTKQEKMALIRKFFDKTRKKCVCGGFLPEDSSVTPDEAPQYSTDSSEKQKYKSFKKHHHGAGQIAKILSNPANAEWISFCEKCRQVFCKPCRFHMSETTCLGLHKSGFRWVLGIPDGQKWDKLIGKHPDPHNNLSAHSDCVFKQNSQSGEHKSSITESLTRLQAQNNTRADVARVVHGVGVSHVHYLMRKGAAASHLGDLFQHFQHFAETIDDKFNVDITQRSELERACKSSACFCVNYSSSSTPTGFCTA